jgi:zinc transporter 1/2/3
MGILFINPITYITCCVLLCIKTHVHHIQYDMIWFDSVDNSLAKVDAIRGSKKQSSKAMLFFIALSLHSVFDGLSIGAENQRDRFNALLIAIGGHKVLDGFALGVPIFFANWSTRSAAYALIFAALMTPLGVGISMIAAAVTVGEKSILTRCIILSMSFGSFLFISLIELLPAGLENGNNINSKMLACTLGWALMAILAAYI